MLPSFCVDAIGVLRPTEKSVRGTTVLDYSDSEPVTVTGCSVQPTDTLRDFDGRTLAIERSFELYAPPGSDIKAGDRIVWQGRTFEVNGAPMEWRSPTGRVSHINARLREWSG